MNRRFVCETRLLPSLLFVAGLAIFLVIGIAVYAGGETTMGLFITIVAASFIVIVIATAVPFRTYYEITDDGLELRNRLSAAFIRFEEIESARIIDDSQAKAILEGLRRRFLDADRNRDTETWRVAGRELREFTRFSTVPVVHGTSSPAIWLKTLSPHTHGSTTYVLLSRKDRTDLLLTPKEREDFILALENRTASPPTRTS